MALGSASAFGLGTVSPPSTVTPRGPALKPLEIHLRGFQESVLPEGRDPSGFTPGLTQDEGSHERA